MSINNGQPPRLVPEPRPEDIRDSVARAVWEVAGQEGFLPAAAAFEQFAEAIAKIAFPVSATETASAHAVIHAVINEARGIALELRMRAKYPGTA